MKGILNNKICIFLITMIVCIIGIENMIANADQTVSKVGIVVDSSKDTYVDVFDATVTIHYYDSSYNLENNMLSYHIIDDTTGEMLKYENNRVSAYASQSQSTQTRIVVDISDVRKEYKKQRLRVVFDVVDVDQPAWFSETLGEAYSCESIVCIKDAGKALIEQLRLEYMSHPIILAINTVWFILAVVYGIRIWKKSRG